MAQKETFTIALKGVMDVSDITSNIKLIQKALAGIKLSTTLSDDFDDTFKKLYEEVNNIEDKLNKGFKTKKDVTGLEQSFQKINKLYSSLVKDFGKIDDKTLDNIIDRSNIKDLEEARQLVKNIKQEISSNLKGNNVFSEIKDNIKDLKSVTKTKTLSNFASALEVGDLKTAGQELKRLQDYASTARFNDANLKTYNDLIQDLTNNFKILEASSGTALQDWNSQLKEANIQAKNIKNDAFQEVKNSIDEATISTEQLQAETKNYGHTLVETGKNQVNFNNELENVKGKIAYFFGLENAIELLKRALRNAFETVKELDAAMTETAVVTDFTVSDMWEALPKYTKVANELGATTLGAYETMTLFYQQGLNTNQTFEIGTETMKMARIASMDYTEATDLMTAALRGFNMELNEISAQKVNDVYSKLAAITAADTQEIGIAMSKTASIASSANMELETTAALLSQIIETTREAPETAGTAMKTIIARFTEVKELFTEGQLTGTDAEGEEININKIDAALKNVGISLKDFLTGQKGLDDILLELASKWDTLDIATQRYIATTAAGSRQQSRFLAMMSNYDRTMELVNAAYNSTGASQKQFEKTQESLEAKLNKLQNAWNEFTMGLANSAVIKGAVDLLTLVLTTINKITGAFGEGASGVLKFVTAVVGLRGTKSIFNSLLKSASSFLKTIKIVNKDGEVFINTVDGISKKASIFEKIKKAFEVTPIANIDIQGNNELLSKFLKDSSQFNSDNIIAYNNAIKAGIPNMQAAILLEQSDWEAKAFNQKITEGLTKAEIEETVAQLNSGKVLRIAKAERLANIKTLLFEKKEKRALAAKALGLAKVEGETTVATSRLGKALLALPLGKILIGITAIIGVIKLLDILIETPTEKIERLQEKADKMAKTAQDAKQAFDELATSIDSIRNADDTFEGLTQGTLEWKKALLEANQSVIDLINKYPELAKYIEKTESGRLTIKDEGLNQFYNKELKKAEQAQGASILSQLDVIKEQKRQAEENKKDYEKLLSRISENERISDLEYERDNQRKRQLTIDKEQAEADILNYEIQEEALADTLFIGLEGAFSQLSSDSQNYLSKLFLNNTDIDEKIIETKTKIQEEEGITTKEEWRQLYKDTFGIEADEELSSGEIADAIAQARVFDDLSNSINELSSTISQLNLDKTIENVVLKGVNETNQLQFSDIQKLMQSEAYGGLGYSQEQIENLSLAALVPNIDDLAKALGTTSAELESNFKKNLEDTIWAFNLVKESTTLTGEALDELGAKIQAQKGVLDAGGEVDFSGLSYKELDQITTDNLTGSEKQQVQDALDRARTTKQANVRAQNENYNEEVDDQTALSTAMGNANITEGTLKKLQSELIATNPLLAENEELLKEVSTLYLNMDTGLRKVADAWDENREALENPEDVVEFGKAIENLRGSVGELLGTEVSYEFVEDNLDLIKQALDGNVDSLIELQHLSTIEFVGNLDLPEEKMNQLIDYVNQYNGFEMEMGAELDDEGFISTLNNMMEQGLMTAEQVQQYLNSMGYEADVKTAERTMTQSIDYDMPGFLGLGKQTGHATITQKVQYIKSIHALGDTAPRKAAKASSSRGGSSGKSGSSGGGSSKQEEPWENTLDRLYNLLEDINEEERIRNKLETEFNRITEDGTYNSNQILKNLRAQEASLLRQQKLQQMLYNERAKEMKNLITGNADLQKYGTYNWSDQTIEINWDLINSVQDNDLGGRIEEYISELERIQDSMDEASDRIEEIKDEVEELKEYGKDEYKDFEDRVLDAVIAREQAIIDNLSAINDSVNDANSNLLDNLTNAIDRMREARDNERTEDEISDTQNRLAYLRRDTSNANRLEILQTQDELAQQEEDYTDTLIDQKINELERQNDIAAEQRQKQIDIMQAQLDRDKEYGLLWNDVYTLWKLGIDNKGVILPQSELLELLQRAEDYQSFSKFGQLEWSQTLKKQVESADTWLQRNAELHLNGVKAQLGAIDTKLGQIKIGTSTVANSKVSSGGSSGSSSGSSSSNFGGSSGGSSSSSSKDKSKANIKKLQEMLNNILHVGLTTDGIEGPATRNAVKILQKLLHVSADGYYGASTRNAVINYINKKGSNPGAWFQRYLANAVYKKGGLADFTGPAWLDGTKSKPEIVLNQRDTQNFLALKDILSNVMQGTNNLSSKVSGDNYYEINIAVDELSNDYDVDKLATKIKTMIHQDGMYRNVNTINLLR